VAIQFENTDTFGGEANYCWVNRQVIPTAEAQGLTDKQLIRRAKAWAGYTGIRCDKENYGDTIALRPRGLCQILFISYCEDSQQ
jgi:hypothetical protein